MNFVDTHVHLCDFNHKYIKDIIMSSVKVGVNKIICVSSKESDWDFVASYYKDMKSNIIPSFGLHPWFLENFERASMFRLEKILLDIPEAIIGEIGLDKNRGYKNQEYVFEKQLEIARNIDRPVIIHNVKSQIWFEKNWSKLPKKFVFHSFYGSEDFLKEIIKKDGYVSFSFSILRMKNFENIVNIVPKDRLIIETDSPYQANEKGIENEPKKLPILATFLARATGVDLEKFSEQVYKNSMEFVKVG